jgi:predicted GTPase
MVSPARALGVPAKNSKLSRMRQKGLNMVLVARPMIFSDMKSESEEARYKNYGNVKN